MKHVKRVTVESYQFLQMEAIGEMSLIFGPHIPWLLVHFQKEDFQSKNFSSCSFLVNVILCIVSNNQTKRIKEANEHKLFNPV